ncbi:hypothetical protein [Paracoccus versutus]|uniref:hypothetical protein n=1 Tax=Paracoccus versutus TaxID=34007 RepID=UPI000DF77CC3|nr:hypothetical protein [Paracoccus versutus]RDD68373.1 hypothetical protein DVR11_27165 [Paracoccus versutus]
MNTTNNITELCELGIRIRPSKTIEGELDCIAELRLCSGDVELGEETCEIAISKMTLSLDVEGLEPVPGSRFGEPRKQPVTEMERTVTQTNSAGKTLKASAGANLDSTTPSFGISASGELQGSSQYETVLSSVDRFEHQRVKARPNLRWEVREPNDAPLDGTYLESDSLVRMSRSERANRAAFVARATVKQRDVAIKQVMQDAASLNFFKRLSTTQRRLMDIFIAKSIDAALRGSGRYSGEITLSSSSIELPHEE